MSSLYADIGGPGSIAAARDGDRRFRAKDNPNIKVELAQRRPSEQGRRRLERRQPMVRRREGRHDRRRAEFRRRARGQPDRPGQEQGVHRVRRRGVRSHRRKCNANTVHWTYDTWMLANGTGKALVKTGGDTWFFLTADYAFGHALERDTGGGRRGQRRQGARQGAPSAQHQRLLVVPAAGAGLQGARSSASPMPAATPSTRSSRRPSSASSRAGRSFAGLLVFVSDVNALGLHDRAGPDLDRDLVLGPERRQPRLAKRWQGERSNGQVPDHGPGRRLCGRHALSEGGRGAQERRRRQGRGRQDEGDADRRPAVRQGHDPRRRPQGPRRCICSR